MPRCLVQFTPQLEQVSKLVHHTTYKYKYRHIAELKRVLQEFGATLSKGFSPAPLTANIVNSNGSPKITYALSTAELNDKQIQALQGTNPPPHLELTTTLGLLIKPVKSDGGHTNRVPYAAYTLPKKMGGYNITSVSALYKASKVQGAYSFINSAYWFTRATTTVHLLDLQRNSRSPHYPLSLEFQDWKAWRTPKYPPFLSTAHEILVENGMEILPKTKWDVNEITIRTFFNCITQSLVSQRIITALEAINKYYMSEISPIFTPHTKVLGTRACQVALWLWQGTSWTTHLANNTTLWYNIVEWEGIGNNSHWELDRGIRVVLSHLCNSGEGFRYIPPHWNTAGRTAEAPFANIEITSAKAGNILCSDGSKRLVGGFAVVNIEGALISRGWFTDHITSQRAECFGLLAAVRCAEVGGTIIADPLYIIKAIQNAINGTLSAKDWKRINNRSLIRLIAHLAKPKQIKFQWVEGHQKGQLDERGQMNSAADREAKEAATITRLPNVQEAWMHTDEHYLMINGTRNTNITLAQHLPPLNALTYPNFHNDYNTLTLLTGTIFEGDIRKEVYNASIQRDIRIFSSIPRNTRFDTENFWWEELLQVDNMFLAPFRFKILTRSLPTIKNMRSYFPGLFDDTGCAWCGELEEDDVHVFTRCKGSNVHRARIRREIMEILMVWANKGQGKVSKAVRHWIPLGVNTADDFWFTTRLPLQLKKWGTKTNKKRGIKSLWQELAGCILKGARKIWEDRCEANKSRGGCYIDKYMSHLDDTQELTQELFINPPTLNGDGETVAEWDEWGSDNDESMEQWLDRDVL